VNPFQQFLDKFSKFLESAKASKKPLIEVIFAVTNVQLKEEELTIKDDIVYLQTHPLVKNEIFMNKKKILAALLDRHIKLRDIR
jgi:hypothetical protein